MSNREIFIKFRVTEEENSYIELCAFQKKYHSKSEYIRTCAIRPINLDDNLCQDFYKEINRQGINLNQIARKLNSEKLEKISDKEIQQLLIFATDQLSLISEQLEQAFKIYGDLRK